MRDTMFVICGMMFTSVSSTTLPYFFKSLKILIILNERMTVAVVEILIPKLKKFIKNPMSVPMTIAKSNLFHGSSVKYLFQSAISLITISTLKIKLNT